MSLERNMAMRDRLEKALGEKVAASSPLPVGFGLVGLKITLAGGRVLAVKARQSAARADLRLEAYMLDELARQSDLPVPRVHVAEATSSSWTSSAMTAAQSRRPLSATPPS
jgi:hypothetical protein